MSVISSRSIPKTGAIEVAEAASHRRAIKPPQKTAKSGSAPLDELADHDQEPNCQRDDPERSDDDLSAWRPPSSPPSRLENRHLAN